MSSLHNTDSKGYWPEHNVEVPSIVHASVGLCTLHCGTPYSENSVLRGNGSEDKRILGASLDDTLSTLFLHRERVNRFAWQDAPPATAFPAILSA